MQISLVFSLIAAVVSAIPRELVRESTSVQSSELVQNTFISSVAAIANVSEKLSSLSVFPHTTTSVSGAHVVGHAATHVIMSISMLPVATSAHTVLATEPVSQDPLHDTLRGTGSAKQKISHVTASVVQRDADHMVIEYPLEDTGHPNVLARQIHQPNALQTSSVRPSSRKYIINSNTLPVAVATTAPTYASTSQVVRVKSSSRQRKARASAKRNARYTSSARPTLQPSSYSSSAQPTTSATSKPAATSTGYAKPAPSSTLRTTSISTNTNITGTITSALPSPSPSPSLSLSSSSISTTIASSKYGSEQESATSTPTVSASTSSSDLVETEPSETAPSRTSTELPSATSSQSAESSATSLTSAYTAEAASSTASAEPPSSTSSQTSISPTLTSVVPKTQSYSAQSSTASSEQPSSVSATSQQSVSSTTSMEANSSSYSVSELTTLLTSTLAPLPTQSSTPPTSSLESSPTPTAAQPVDTSSTSLVSSSSSVQKSAAPCTSSVTSPTKTTPEYSALGFASPTDSSHDMSEPIYWSSEPNAMPTASLSPPSPSSIHYSATEDAANIYAPTSSHPSKMDISVSLKFTVDYAGETGKDVYTELSQSNAVISARIMYDVHESSSSSYSSTTTTTITVYPTLVPTSLTGYSNSLDSTAESRNHYHHHLRASSQKKSEETYLFPDDEVSAISNAKHMRNKHISVFLEPTPANTIVEDYFVATIDS